MKINDQNFWKIRSRLHVFINAAVITAISVAVSLVVTYLLFSDQPADLLAYALKSAIWPPLLLAGPFSLLFGFFALRTYGLRRELQDKDQQLQELIAAIPDAVTRATPSGILTFANRRYLEMVGQGEEDVVGRYFFDFVHASELDRLRQQLAILSEEEPLIQHRQFHVFPDGGAGWILWSDYMRHDAKGQPIELLSIGKDITELQLAMERNERHANEMKQANESLTKAYEELDQFAHIASHDLQEPLRKISVFAELLEESVNDDDKEAITHAAGVMSGAAQRGRKLVRDLMTLSRTTNQEDFVVEFDVANLIKTVIVELSHLILSSGADISVDLEPLPVRADKRLAQDVISNLLQNAIKYVAPGTTPIITIRNGLGTPNSTTITITDHGIGFDPEHAETIFKPFKRLHSRDQYSGTGIGLAIVSKAADRLNWTISATSSPGVGSTFHIGIPTAMAPARQNASAAETE